MAYHYHPELEIALMEKAARSQDLVRRPSPRDQFRHSTAGQKRIGAARAIACAREFREQAAPHQATGRELRREGRQLIEPFLSRLIATHILTAKEQAVFTLGKEKMQEGQRAAKVAQPLLAKAEALEGDAVWLTRSADWQDFRTKVKKALYLS